MDRDEIISMAISYRQNLRDRISYAIDLERKACAEVCDELAADAAKEQDFHALFAAESCADAIRERGQDEMSQVQI